MNPSMFPIVNNMEGILTISKNNRGISGAFSQSLTDPKDIIPKVNIPKIIHIIWLGSPPPKSVQKVYDSWLEAHFTWKMSFWNDNNIHIVWNDFAKQYPYEVTPIKALFDELTIPAYKADVLRLVILLCYGGVYVDSDMLCLQPIDTIIQDCTGFTSFAHQHINNGLFGSIKNSSWIWGMLQIINQYKDYLPGPRAMTEGTSYHPEIRIFHELTFNPVQFDDPKLIHLREFLETRVSLQKILNSPCAKKCREFSYALHLWNFSWNKS
jgi:hypothetical protein